LVDDFSDDWESADVIRKVRFSYGSLMRKKGQLGWIDQNLTTDLLHVASEEKPDDDDATGDHDLSVAQVYSKKMVECIECHVSYVYQDSEQEEEDIEDWTEERLIATISTDTRTLLRLVRLRDLRFSNEHVIRRKRIFEEPGLAYGCSMYEKLKGIQENASDIFSLFMNVSILLMIPWYLYSNKAGIKQDQAIEPGKGIECDDPSAVVFPTWRVDLSSILKSLEIFFQLHSQTGNIGDVQTGQAETSKADVKATEIMAMVQESNIKFNYMSNTIRDDFIDLLKAVYDLYYQNMPYDYTWNYQGQPVPIPRPTMRRKLKFRLTGSTELSNKLLERKESQEKYMMLRQDPIVNPVPLLEDVIKHYDPDSQVARYINQDVQLFMMALAQNPELPQVIGQYLNQKKMATQAAGGAQQPGQGPQGGMGA
jgi:hypothetical protein